MNTVGLIALTFLGALFLFAVLGGVAVLIWLAWSLKKQTAAIAASEAPASAKQPKKGGDFDPPEGAGPK